MGDMQGMLARFGLQLDIYRAMAIIGLIIARILPAVFQAPFIGGKAVPSRAKIATALAISIPLYFPISQTVPASFSIKGASIIILLLKEVFIGLTMGLVISMVFEAAEAGGRFLDNARGMGSAVLVAPETGAQVTLMGQLFFQMTVAMYLIIGGHRLFLIGLYDSFTVLPVDRFPIFPPGMSPFIEWVLRMSAQLLVIALKIVAPGVIATLMTDFVMGIANRVSPQINVFMLSMPIKMMVATLMTLLTLELVMRSLDTELLRYTRGIQDLFLIWTVGGR